MSNNDNSNNQNENPRRRTGIRGPRSALTDFLQSQNISANAIREGYNTRRAEAEASEATAQANGTGGPPNDADAPDDADDADVAEASTAATQAREARARKRKDQNAAIDKIKKSKAFKKRKRDEDSDADSDDIALGLFNEKPTAAPGQSENCEICNKRFTVTPYTRAGPNGGLLCPKCAKEVAKDDNNANKKKKAPHPGGPTRRSRANKLLDGYNLIGANSLMTMAISLLVQQIHLADDFGNGIPPHTMDKIARHLSKRRLYSPETLDLFLKSATEEVTVYDGSKLGVNDYTRIMSHVPTLKHLKLKNAVQFKDEVMEYLMSRAIALESLYLHGANLLSEERWLEYLGAKGKSLKALQIYFTDKHVGDDFLAKLKDLTPNLKRLKICHNQKVSDAGIKELAQLKGLEHLGLHLITPTTTAPLVATVQGIGHTLQTLSIRDVPNTDDRLLDAIHSQCASLSKLRITESEHMTDAGFSRLFNDWGNKPLLHADFEKCRHVDSSNPRENSHMVGFCSDAFRALMSHSGNKIRNINLHACRHISREAFEEVFSQEKEYPELRNLEISFCEEVNDFVVGCIFRSCPNIRKVNVFGCMKVKSVRVPRGVLLIGVPNAQGMVMEGDDDDE